MKAMILAAGYGSRMGEFGKHIPKSLISVHGEPLIGHHLKKLARANITDVVINVHTHADKIQATIGQGEKYNLNITYSIEQEKPLGTGGGIYHALPLLGNDPFLLISADIWTEFDFNTLPKKLVNLGHLVLVDNQPDHPKGDFGLLDHQVNCQNKNRLTFSSIAVLHPQLFSSLSAQPFSITEALLPAIQQNEISGEKYSGRWVNINTVEKISSI